MKIYLRLILTLVLFVVASVSAQTPLTLQQAIEIGLENSNVLHSSQMKVQMATSKSSEVNAMRLPSLKLNGTYTRLSDVPPFEATIPANAFGPGFPPNQLSVPLSPTILNNYTARLTLQQPIFTGFRLDKTAEIADYSAQAANEEYNKDKSELIYSIKQSYWNLFKATEFKKVVDENVEQVRAHLNDVQNMMKHGMVTKNEVLKVEVQLSNVKLLQIEANNNVQLAMIALNSIIGNPLNTEIQIASTPSTPQEQSPDGVQDVNSLVKTALEHRPEMKAMKLRVDAADAGITAAKSGWFPQIYLVGNYYYSRPNQRYVPAQDIFRDSWDISLNASFDVWNWGTTIHQTQQAQAQYEQAKDGLRQLEDGITLEVTQNFLNRKQAREKIVVTRQTVEQAEENYRVTNDKFKLGLVPNSDLIDAEVALLQAKTAYTQALVDYELAQAKLEKSLGKQE